MLLAGGAAVIADQLSGWHPRGWDGGLLAHLHPKESEDEPAAITLGGLEAFPHTLSTSLTVRAVNGKLSRLALASSPGAFTAPQMARRLRSVSQPSDQPQMI
jgi:hypothetical protein